MLQSHTVDGLEVLSCLPSGTCQPTPLLFVHGAFAAAWTWADHFLPWFAAHGYRSYALSYRGHGGSEQHETLHWHSLADYVDDLIRVIDWLDEKPVLIGHSLGGFVVQRYLEHQPAAGAVLMCSAPPQGLMAARFHLLMKNPASFMDVNQLLETDFSNPNVVRNLLFAAPADDDVVNGYAKRMQAESQRALLDISMFHHVGLSSNKRPPMLILGAEHDALIPPFLVQSTARTYDLPHRIFRGAGHALTHEKKWPIVAAAIEDWLAQNKL